MEATPLQKQFLCPEEVSKLEKTDWGTEHSPSSDQHRSLSALSTPQLLWSCWGVFVQMAQGHEAQQTKEWPVGKTTVVDPHLEQQIQWGDTASQCKETTRSYGAQFVPWFPQETTWNEQKESCFSQWWEAILQTVHES